MARPKLVQTLREAGAVRHPSRSHNFHHAMRVLGNLLLRTDRIVPGLAHGGICDFVHDGAPSSPSFWTATLTRMSPCCTPNCTRNSSRSIRFYPASISLPDFARDTGTSAFVQDFLHVAYDQCLPRYGSQWVVHRNVELMNACGKAARS